MTTAERAVQVLNHRNIGNRYIEVFMSSEAEMAQASVSPTAQQQAGVPQWQADGPGANGIVRLRGLPFNSTPEMLMHFFQGFEIPKGAAGVHMVLGANGRPNGEVPP